MKLVYGLSGRKRAFTLVEVIISIVIMFFALLFTIQLLASGFQFLWRTKNKTVVVTLAQKKMEELIRAGTATTTTWVSFPGSTYPGFEDFQYNITVVSPYDANNKLQQVTVRVRGPMQKDGTVLEYRTVDTGLMSILAIP